MNATVDAAAGEYLTPAQVSESFGRLEGGRPRVPYPTVIRWIRHGYPLPGGKVVKLAAEQVGARLTVTRAALDAFRAAITRPAAVPDPATVMPTESPTARKLRLQKGKEAAAKLLRG